MVDQSTIWMQYLQALQTKVTLESGEALQAIYPYKSWDWGGRSPVANAYSYDQWLALNIVPSDPLQDQDSGAAASQLGFDAAYLNWANMLAVGDLAHDEAYQKLQDALTASANKYNTDYLDIQNVWKNQTEGASPDFNTWLNDPAQLSYNTQIAENKNDLSAKQEELDDYRSRIKSPVKTIIQDFNNENYQSSVRNPASGKSVPLKIWRTNPLNPFAYIQQITNNNFGSDATKGAKDTIRFNHSTQTFSQNDIYVAGKGKWFDFIRINAKGSYEQIDLSQSNSEYSIEIGWQDLKTIPITPDAWYKGTNITTYGKKGPYATGFSAFQSNDDNYFFGPGGAISRIYTAMIVCYRPTVTISGSESFSTDLQKRWEASTGLQIGPFYFRGKSAGGSHQSTATTTDGKFTIESHDDWPLIIGQKSAWTLSPKQS